MRAPYVLQENVSLQGSGVQSGPTLAPGEFRLTFLSVPRAPFRSVTSLRMGITDRLEAGIGYSYGDKKALGSATYLVLEETKHLPNFMLGVGTRAAVTTDIGAYVSSSKDLRPFLRLPVRGWLTLYRQLNDGKSTPYGGGGLGVLLSDKYYFTLQSYGTAFFVTTLDVKLYEGVTAGVWAQHQTEIPADKTKFGFSFGYQFLSR